MSSTFSESTHADSQVGAKHNKPTRPDDFATAAALKRTRKGASLTDNEQSDNEPPIKRAKRTEPGFLKHGKHSVNMDYGMRSALPGLGHADDGESPDDMTMEALAYLRSVRLPV